MALGTPIYLQGSASAGSATPAAAQYWPGGAGALSCTGTFGGGTIQLKYVAPDSASTQVSIGSGVTSAGVSNFSLPPGYIIVTLTGATGPSLTVAALQVPTALV